MTALSADRPSSDPKDDLFGHAPFAKSLADSICRYPGNDGLVLALYGPWGSGKSTVLSYVRHFLDQRPETEQPVIVDFNPWWFSGQDNLARAFLGQLQAVLPEKFAGFKKLGEKLSEFSEGIGGLVELAGAAAGVGGVVGHGLKLIAPKPKDIPALKREITEILLKEKKRVLVVIDDIDRLTPDETRQLFTVIKALADFPNVIYLLAFDREVAAKAIEEQSGLPGQRYLEKIIQVPFELPPVDRVALQAALFKRLDEVMAGTPDGLFDSAHWSNVFHDGIDTLIKVPRDIVRFINTLSVTYPSVIGDVNPVDFIAIEALRVFLPSVYDVVRTNQEHFAGVRSTLWNGNDDKERQAFHNAWLQDVPEELQKSTMELMQRLFAKLNKTTYTSDWLLQWRRELRVCHPDCFPTYFRFAVPPGTVRRSEMLALLALADTPSALGDALIMATHEKRPDGLSKARALLERLMDYVEGDIPIQHIPGFINVLFDVGDQLVLPSDEQGTFDFGNESRVTRIVYHLLKRVEREQRLPMMTTAIAQGRGIGVQRYLVNALSEEISKQGGGDALMEAATVEQLKITWLEQLRAQSTGNQLLENTQLARLLGAWNAWGDPAEARARCERVTASDEGLLAFLPNFCSHTTSQTIGDRAVRVRPRLNPAWLEQYIDTASCADRLTVLQQAGQIPESAKEAAAQFLKEFEMIKAGKKLDGFGAFDD